MKHISQMEKRAEKALKSLNSRFKNKQDSFEDKKLSLSQIKEQLKKIESKFGKKFETKGTDENDEATLENDSSTFHHLMNSNDNKNREVIKEGTKQKTSVKENQKEFNYFKGSFNKVLNAVEAVDKPLQQGEKKASDENGLYEEAIKREATNQKKKDLQVLKKNSSIKLFFRFCLIFYFVFFFILIFFLSYKG